MDQKNNNLSDFLSGITSQIDTGRKTERNNAIAMKYFGFDGHGGMSMNDAGIEVGSWNSNNPKKLTRESVRQIINKVSDEIRKTVTPDKEMLEAAAKIIESHTPSSAERVESALVESGLMTSGFRIEGLIHAMEIFGRKAVKIKPIKIVKHNGKRFLIYADQQNIPKEIEGMAKTLISHNGATSVEDIAKKVKGIPRDIKSKFVRDVVTSVELHTWIGEEQNWFFFGQNGRNRLRRRLQAIFSVIESATIHNIHKAIARSWKKNEVEHRTSLISEDVLHDLIVASDEYEISDNLVRAKHQYNPAEKLNEVEIEIIKEFKKADKTQLREKVLEDAILEKIDGKWAFSISLNYSPILIKSEDIKGKEIRGVYELVGTLRE